MIATPDTLADLEPIEASCGDEFFAEVVRSGQISGRYYFPYLSLYTRSYKTLLWERYNGSICVYHLSQSDDDWRFALFLPPFPQNDEAMAHAMERIRRFTGRRSTRIIWTDGQQHPWVDALGFSTYLASLSPEFLYEAAKVRDATGKDFERMRRMVNKARRMPGLEIRSYRREDRDPCKEFLQHWRAWKKARGRPFGGVTLAQLCIDRAFQYGNLMRGEVMTLDDRICGFTFGGPVSPTVGSLLVTIADNELPGLAYLQRYNFITNTPYLDWFSDTTSAGLEGLAHLKNAFRPFMHPLYRARHDGKAEIGRAPPACSTTRQSEDVTAPVGDH